MRGMLVGWVAAGSLVSLFTGLVLTQARKLDATLKLAAEGTRLSVQK